MGADAFLWVSALNPGFSPRLRMRITSASTVTAPSTPKRACVTNCAFSLVCFPAEILEEIITNLLSSDPRGTRLARVSRVWTPLVREVCRDRITWAWWTGCLPPSRPLPDTMPLEVVATKSMGTLSAGDILKVETHCGWLNNFGIIAALHAMRLPHDIISPILPRMPSDNTDIAFLSPEICACVEYHNAGSYWSRRDVLAGLCQARVVICPINTRQCHWATLHVNVKLGLAELFESMPGCTCMATVDHVLSYISWAHDATRSTDSWKIKEHTHPAWTQHDGSSCGIYTLVVMSQLSEGRRVEVREDDVPQWRSFLGRLIRSRIAFT